MERYFFHLHEGGVDTPDEEGRELVDLAAVRTHALAGARSIMCAEISEGRLCLGGSIEVTDKLDSPIHTLLFKDAVAVTDWL